MTHHAGDGTREDLELMHKRFRHANIESIVESLTRLLKDMMHQSNKATQASKHHLPSFPNASTVKGSGPGKYVVCDIQH